jgi:transcriptional regulator with XRE-family HTH domain
MGEEPRCPLRELARRLGVSQTYIQKLVRGFAADPSKTLRQASRLVRGCGMASISANGRMQIPYERRSATFEQLNEAQQISRKMRERGWLRSPSPKQKSSFTGCRYFQHFNG